MTPSLPILMRTLAVPALLLLVTILFPAPGVAHSFDRNFASARYVTEVEGRELWVAVVVEMPTLDVLGDFRRFLRDHPGVSDEENTESFRLRQLADVAAALELQVDGVTLEGAWRPVENEANGKGDTDFFVYMVEHRRAVAGARVEVEVVNRLQPEKVVFLSSRAVVGEQWRLEEDSAAPLLEDGLDGEIVGPDVAAESSGKWTTNEALRRVHLVFSRPGGR